MKRFLSSQDVLTKDGKAFFDADGESCHGEQSSNDGTVKGMLQEATACMSGSDRLDL